MVILIGGESHTGKTLLAQNILEKYHIPYTSLDHIKMGLIRGLPNCDFSALCSDDIIADKLFNIVKGIIDTCIENKQNIILEGCYLPPEQVSKLNQEDILPIYLIFSSSYIQNNFYKIIEYENRIEHRLYSSDLKQEEYIKDNERLKNRCIKANLPFFEINLEYQQELQAINLYLQKNLIKLHLYNPSDLDAISSLFYDTVHTVCRKDYSSSQLNAWATGTIDKKAWNQSLLNHYTIVAKIGNKLVGFGDMDGNYLDRLYVDKNYQSIGVGKKIVHALEKHTKASYKEKACYITHASITARPFFESIGYHVVKEQQVTRNGEVLTNFIMNKPILFY